jgi:uncharacterized protein
VHKQVPLKLSEVLDKYRGHPQFLGIELVDPNQRGALDDTVLHVAAATRALADIDVLVSSGAEVNAIGDLGYTPLHQAAMRGHADTVKRLLDLGADPTIRNEFGEDAIQVAEIGDHPEVAQMLKTHRMRRT